MGYVVTWCEIIDGKRVKRREEYTVDKYGSRIACLEIAQLHAKRLRGLNYAACVEPLQ
jgi:hypothetical protein